MPHATGTRPSNRAKALECPVDRHRADRSVRSGVRCSPGHRVNLSPADDTPVSRRVLFALLALLAVLWFALLGWRDLVPTDEGRYAEIPREMVVSGDWVTPRLDGFKYFEKPPLQYWATAATYEAFGIGAWQARLWTALTGFLTIVLTAYAGRVLYGARTGLAAAAVLASSLYWIGLGHINTLDMGVAATLSAALLSFLLAQRDDASAAARRGWMALCWVSMALALLSKGLIGLAFPGMTLVLYSALQRDARLWTRVHLLGGLVLFAIVALPWFVLVQRHNPEFFDFFFVYQQFTRFLTPALSRPGPWYYFVPLLLLGSLPWVGWLLPALWRARRAAPGRLQPDRVLLIWSVFIFVFFSASHSKLPSYILPMFPALALLIARHLQQLPHGALRRPLLLLAAGCVLAALGLTQLWRLGHALVPAALYRDWSHWLELAAALGLAGSIAALRLEHRARRTAAVVALAIGFGAGFTVALQSFQILGRTASTRDVVAAIRPWLHPGQPFYMVQTYDQTLPFYLRREATVVEYQGELAFGIAQAPQRWVPTLQDFAQRWAHDRLPLAFMPADSDALRTLRAMRLPLRVIERTPRYLVIARPDQDYGAAARAAQAALPPAWNASAPIDSTTRP